MSTREPYNVLFVTGFIFGSKAVNPASCRLRFELNLNTGPGRPDHRVLTLLMSQVISYCFFLPWGANLAATCMACLQLEYSVE
jgi:hypothetical protein